MTPAVGVLLLNWNSGEFTLECLRSLQRSTHRPARVLVVDNASHDGSPEAIAREFPEVEIVRNATNEGFARGNNIGMARLLARNVDYVWVLNNDTTVKEDCLAELVRAAQARPDAGCFTGKILFATPPHAIWYAGGVRDRLSRAPRHVLDDRLERAGLSRVEFISGCSMLIPASVLQTVGGFRSGYVAYSEDSEWCWRARDLGYELWYAPSSVLWHHVSASVRKNTGRPQDFAISSRGYYLMVRNHFWTLRLRVRSALERSFRLTVFCVVTLRIVAYCAVHGQPGKIASVLRGALAGLLRPVPRECSVAS